MHFLSLFSQNFGFSACAVLSYDGSMPCPLPLLLHAYNSERYDGDLGTSTDLFTLDLNSEHSSFVTCSITITSDSTRLLDVLTCVPIRIFYTEFKNMVTYCGRLLFISSDPARDWWPAVLKWFCSRHRDGWAHFALKYVWIQLLWKITSYA